MRRRGDDPLSRNWSRSSSPCTCESLRSASTTCDDFDERPAGRHTGCHVLIRGTTHGQQQDRNGFEDRSADQGGHGRDRLRERVGGCGEPRPAARGGEHRGVARESESSSRPFSACATTKTIAPSAGLTITDHEFMSEPDGNTVNLQLIRPQATGRVAVRVLHPRRRHADDVVLRRHVPGVGPHHRRARAWPWRWSTSATALIAVVGARGRAVPCRPERLRVGPEVGRTRMPRELGIDPTTSSSPARAAAATSPWPPGCS